MCAYVNLWESRACMSGIFEKLVIFYKLAVYVVIVIISVETDKVI